MKLIKKAALGKLELYTTEKHESGFPYEIRPTNINEPLWGGDRIEEAKIYLETFEKTMFPAHHQLMLHDTKVIWLSKRQRKNLIFKAYSDNFERIKKLKEYGVIK